MEENCLFCKIIHGEIPSQKIYEDDNVYAFNDINPVSPTHVLIIPKEHITMVSDLKDEDHVVVGKLFVAAKIIAEKLKIKDYRIVVNNGKDVGQTVFHIHLHLMAGRFFSWPPG